MKIKEVLTEDYRSDLEGEVWHEFRKKLNAEQQKQVLDKFEITDLSDMLDFDTKEVEKLLKYMMKLNKLTEAASPIGMPEATEDQYHNPVRGVAYKTESGWYGVTKDGKSVVFDNSGYKQTFTADEIKRGLKTGDLSNRYGDWEMFDTKGTISIENGDEEHWFDIDVIKTLL